MKQDLRFKYARQGAGFKQYELARIVGVSESIISKIETGRMIIRNRELRDKIAKVLNCRTWEIGI